MRVIYMGKDKPSVLSGLRFLTERGIEIIAVVTPPRDIQSQSGEYLADLAEDLGIYTTTEDKIYQIIEARGNSQGNSSRLHNIDLVISYLYPYRIRRPLINLGNIGCINLHPGPLPEARGLGGYNIAITEAWPTYGVTAHFVDDRFDTGDVILEHRFSIDTTQETAFSLEQKSMTHLLALFCEVIHLAENEKALPRIKQADGRYVNRQEFESLKRILPTDSLETIERKVRGFWYPPYEGATIDIHGKKFTLVDEHILRECANKYHKTNKQ